MMKKILAAATLVVIFGLGAQTFAAGAPQGDEKQGADVAEKDSEDSQDASKAEPNGDKAAKHPAGRKSEPASQESKAGHASDHDEGRSVGEEAHGADIAHHGCPVCPARTPAEMDVLMTLRERSAELEAREAVVARREHALTEMEKSLDKQVAQLDSKMDQLEKRLDMAEPGRAEKEKRIVALVETLSGLTAKKASPILAETEPEVAAELLRRMDGSKAAALLAIMPPVKAGQFVSLGLGKKNNAAAGTSAPAAKNPPEATP